MFSLLLTFKRKKNSEHAERKRSVNVKTSTERKLQSQQSKPQMFNTHESPPVYDFIKPNKPTPQLWFVVVCTFCILKALWFPIKSFFHC